VTAKGPDASDTHTSAGRGTQLPARPIRDEDDLTETVVGSEVIHQGHIELRIDTVERRDGSQARREIVGHPGAVAVVALDPDGRVLLVRQFRLAAGRAMLEIPAGTLDVDESSGALEDAEVAARRELEEETGYRAAEWRRLVSFWTAPGFATEVIHLYLATGLSPADDGPLGPEEDERLILEPRTLPDALEAVASGEIADAKSIVGLLWLARLRDAAP
jgi:ADP-ribose pyrophosphatase